MFDTMIEEAIPAGLDTMAPGPVLAAILATIDTNEVSGHNRVVVLRAHQRMASHYTAAVYRDMAAVTDAYVDPDSVSPHAAEDAAAELRAALVLTRRAAESELVYAHQLHRRLPKVWNALAAGRIDPRRARVIVSATDHLDQATARHVTGVALDQAAGLTTGQLGALIRRLCIETDPDDAEDRYDMSVADRRVVASPTTEGTTNLYGLNLAPDRAAAAMDRINRIARSLRGPSEDRTMDQLRADVALDLLAGTRRGARHARKGVVDIQVDLDTLTELADAPGELAGYGPVIADIARQVADRQHDAEWRYTITDPVTGDITANGVTRRRPTATQRREVQARYRTCVFPGCRMPATGCDLDHRIPYAEGGPTDTDHLGPACRHDHTTRHRAGWTYRRLNNGDHHWTSPLGHTYTTRARPP